MNQLSLSHSEPFQADTLRNLLCEMKSTLGMNGGVSPEIENVYHPVAGGLLGSETTFTRSSLKGHNACLLVSKERRLKNPNNFRAM